MSKFAIFIFALAMAALPGFAKNKAAASTPLPQENPNGVDLVNPLFDLPIADPNDHHTRAKVNLTEPGPIPHSDTHAMPSPDPAPMPASGPLTKCDDGVEAQTPEKIEALAKEYYSLVGSAKIADLDRKAALSKELMHYVATYDPATCFRGEANFEKLCLQMQSPNEKIDIHQPELGPAKTPGLKFQRAGDKLRNIWNIYYRDQKVGMILDDDHDGYLDTLVFEKSKDEVPDFGGGAGAPAPSNTTVTILHGSLAGKINYSSPQERCLGAGLNPAKFYERLIAAGNDLILKKTSAADNGSIQVLRALLWDSYFEGQEKKAR